MCECQKKPAFFTRGENSSALKHVTKDIHTTDSATISCYSCCSFPSSSPHHLLHQKCCASSTKTNSNPPSFHCEHETDATASTVEQPLVVFGIDLSKLSINVQFFSCAGGVFLFTIIYAYLQELISVHVTGRQYTMFLSTCQFAGYAFWSFILTKLAPRKIQCTTATERIQEFRPLLELAPTGSFDMTPQPSFSSHLGHDGDAEYSTDGQENDTESASHMNHATPATAVKPTPWKLYIMLSFLRAIDVGMTNGAMRFLNYPTKTLIKSSRVAFTMIGGVIIGRKRYGKEDYWMVSMLVVGLCFFIHADMHSKDAVFHPLGLAMLMVSLACDGAVANYSELTMIKQSVSQDEFQFSIYSISFVFMLFATIISGEFAEAFQSFFLKHGTIAEIQNDHVGLYHHHRTNPSWTIWRKIMVLVVFTLMGLCGSSCAGAITKKFGALSMSITSTTRKAFTLFISFVAFRGNKCTPEHFEGMVVFMSALFMKSVRGVWTHQGWSGLFRHGKIREADDACIEDKGLLMIGQGQEKERL